MILNLSLVDRHVFLGRTCTGSYSDLIAFMFGITFRVQSDSDRVLLLTRF